MALGLCFIFFLSGAAALIFETLWFRLVGLQLGNSVWTSSIVLAAFMCGLALGNALAFRHGDRIARPLVFYAVMEGIVGVVGFVVILSLPHMTYAIVPLVRSASLIYGGVNLLRWVVAFGVMLVPATAMGLTLPLLAKALARFDPRFGSVLGKLYGWNTLGGVAGVLCAELFLIQSIGLRGTGLVAGASNMLACLVALLLARHPILRQAEKSDLRARVGIGALPPFALRLLAAAFLAGAAIMALEVVWFRFMQLFVYGTALTFSAMLAVILAGIGAGGLFASLWIARSEPRIAFLPMIALLAGVVTEMSYFAFSPVFGDVTFSYNILSHSLALSLRLMFPTAFFSGVLFTTYGHVLRRNCGEEAETAGLLTLFNTMGATVGAVLGGLVMLPRLGMETSLFVLTLVYCAVALLPFPISIKRGERRVLAGIGILSAICFALFPFGLMRGRYLGLSLSRFLSSGRQVVAFREGLTESIALLKSEWGYKPVSYHLITNGHSMSDTSFRGLRYMKLFVYWANALRPKARSALLISYGIGTTASALHRSRQFESIDVVDISRDIIEVSDLVYRPEEHPLHDPRVRVHIEDGRFFLQTTDKKFDLITAEPPPPKGAGIVNLYTREFFQLVGERLSADGIVTYWFPTHTLTVKDCKAIARAFCGVFEDCSLWRGAADDWMLVGSRGTPRRLSEKEFRSPWDDPEIVSDLVDIGIERPEQHGALFIADRDELSAFSGEIPPLEDNYPGRLAHEMPTDEELRMMFRWADTRRAAARFGASAFIEQTWPASLRRRTIPYFVYEGYMDDLWLRTAGDWRPVELDQMMRQSPLRTLPLLMMGSQPKILEIARRAAAQGVKEPGLSLQLGIGHLARREYADAVRQLRDALRNDGDTHTAGLWLAFALFYQDRHEEALESLESVDRERLERWKAEYQWLRDRLTESLKPS